MLIKIVRNQIDYIMIRKRYRNSIKSAKTYPGADIASDHNPVVATFRLTLKRIKQTHKDNKMNILKLKNQEIRNRVKEQINTEVPIAQRKNQDEENVNTKWSNIKNTMLVIGKQELNQEARENKKEWMTKEILEMIERRRKAKVGNKQRYKELHRQIQKKVKEAKERWLNEKCDEIERLQKIHDSFNIHKRVKEMTGGFRNKQNNILIDDNGKMILDLKDKLRTWKEYTEKLFQDDRNRPQLVANNVRTESPHITNEEVIFALKNTKNGKAPGTDEMPVELLKLLKENNIPILTDLFNTIHKTGVIPREWLISTFVAIPKINNAKKCKDHRTISLMSHTLKLFLKVIHNRIYRKLDSDISDSQFGFRNGVGTREALFAVNVLTQRCLDVNKDVYACLVDYEKAFDRVRHDQLMKILREKQLDAQDIIIIQNLYYHQTANIRVENVQTEDIEIRRGVRQGCILSPLLFNLYSEAIMREALYEEQAGVLVNGMPVSNIRYADDTVLLAENANDLQRIVQKVHDVSIRYGLNMNLGKTKFIVFTKNPDPNVQLIVNNQSIDRVYQYKYLGTLINSNNDFSKELKARIENARRAFINMKQFFCSRALNNDLKMRMLRCYIFTILLYGIEAATLTKAMMKKIEAFEMWLYRRILRISYVDRVTNEEVLLRLSKQTELNTEVKIRKLQYLGHIMRGTRYQMLQVIIQGKIVGKRSVGRRRMSWLRNLREWFNCSSNHLFRAAVNKLKIIMMIANLRQETAP